MSEPTIKDLFNKKNRRITISVIVSIAVILLLVVVTSQPKSQPAPVTMSQEQLDATLARDTSDANLIKAVLTQYYVRQGSYPFDYESIVEYVNNDDSGNWDTESKKNFNDIQTHLKDLDYTVKGDRQAYRFTYTDITGKPVTVDGDYKNDYR
jgi:hypothetical protein